MEFGHIHQKLVVLVPLGQKWPVKPSGQCDQPQPMVLLVTRLATCEHTVEIASRQCNAFPAPPPPRGPPSLQFTPCTPYAMHTTTDHEAPWWQLGGISCQTESVPSHCPPSLSYTRPFSRKDFGVSRMGHSTKNGMPSPDYSKPAGIVDTTMAPTANRHLPQEHTLSHGTPA